MSNTGYLAGMAAMEAVKQVGLGQAAIACLAGVPPGVPTVMNRLRSAERVVAIDGCATDCARKVAEAAGLTLTRSITLADGLRHQKGSLPRAP